MKRESPKEVWLHHNVRTGWQFSFDPPLKRFEMQMHRMVSVDVVQRQRAEIRRLRGAVKAGLAREKNLRGIGAATMRESEQRLNMLEHIEWHNGAVKPESRDALRAMVGLEALSPKRKRGGGR